MRLPNTFEHLQCFQVKCVLLDSKAGKGWLLDLGRMFAHDTKTVCMSVFWVT